MITIENKKTSIFLTEDKAADYATLLLHLLNRPVSKSIDMKSMRRDIKLMDLLELGGDNFTMSNEDAKYLADLAVNSEWGGRHRDLVAFYDYFEAFDTTQTN